jgi:tetratricopeptide (TPR) repeat protein
MLTRKGQIRQGASRWRLPSPAKWSELQFWVLSCSVWKPQTGLAPSSEAEHVPACAACIRWPARNVRAAIAQLVSWAATVRNAVSDSHKQPVEVEELLRLDGPWTDAIARHATAVRSAWHLGDRLGQANALNNLGIVRLLPGDFRGAAGDLEQALVIYRDIGDREGQAEVLNETGTLHRVTGEPAEADACHQQALELARAIGSTPHEAHALRPPQRSACDWLQHAPKLNRSVRAACRPRYAPR